jgi:hypothetical protein
MLATTTLPYGYSINNGTIAINNAYIGLGGDVTIPSTITGLPVTRIGDNAFSHCTNLTSITIPNSVTSIGDQAFFYCTNLTSVTIGNSVTSIGGWAFSGCSRLTAFKVDTQNPSYSSLGGVLFDKDQSTLIQYPLGIAGAYSIPSSVTSIGGWAFYGCPSLTSVTIPKGVTSIAAKAFGGCSNLKEVYFEGNAPRLYSDAFSNVNATIFYLPGTTGWGATFSDLPTALWLRPAPLILKSGPGFGVQTNRFGFTISWATNNPVVVETTTDLTNPTWSPVATNTLAGGTSFFSDAQWEMYPRRFYRLRSP